MQIFVAFFSKAPETVELFRHFRGKPISELPHEPQFRAHAWAVGYQLASMVEYSADATLLEALIRKNAKSHTTRRGVKPEHFGLIGKTVIDVMKSKGGKYMTPAAIASWEKLFYCMGKLTTLVYEEEIDRSKTPPPGAAHQPGEKGTSDSGADVHATASESTASEGGSTTSVQASSAAAGGSASAHGAAPPTAAQAATSAPKHDEPATPNSAAHQGASTGAPPASGAASKDGASVGTPSAPPAP